MPTAHLSLKERRRRRSGRRVQEVIDHHRLEHVQLQVSGGAADVETVVVAQIPAATMVMASHWVGLTFRHDRRAGLVVRDVQFADAAARVEASRRMSLAISSGNKRLFQAPWASTIASCAASASNLFSAVTNGRPVSFTMCFATLTS